MRKATKRRTITRDFLWRSLLRTWARAKCIVIHQTTTPFVEIDGAVHCAAGEGMPENVAEMRELIRKKPGDVELEVRAYADGGGPSALPEGYQPKPMHEQVSRDLWCWSQDEYDAKRTEFFKAGRPRHMTAVPHTGEPS